MTAEIQSNEILRDYFGKLQGGGSTTADSSSLVEAILVFGIEYIRLNYVHSSSLAQQIIADARKVAQVYSKSKKEGDSIGLREELGSIKEELLKLNEKFETKLNTLSSNSEKGRIAQDVKKVSVPAPPQIKTDPKRMQRSSSLSAVGTQKRRLIPQEATSTRAAALNQANHYDIFTQDQEKPFGIINPQIRQAKRTSVTPKVTEIVPKLEKPIRYAPKISQQSDVQIKALLKEDSILMQDDDNCQVHEIQRNQATKQQKNTHQYGQVNQGKLQQQQTLGQRKKRAQSNYESQQKQQQAYSQPQYPNQYYSKQNQSSGQTLNQEQELQYEKQQQQQQQEEEEGQFTQYVSDEKTLMGNISPKFNEAISATQRIKSNESLQHRPPTNKGSSHNNTAVYYDPRKMGKGQLFGKHSQSNQYKHVESKIKGQLQHHRSMSRNSDNSSINNRTNISSQPYQSQYYQASQDRSLSQQQQYPYQGESAQESQVIEDSAQLEDRPRQQLSSNNYTNNSFNRQSRVLSSQQYQQQSQSLNQTQNQNMPPQDVFSLGRIPQNEEYNRYSSQPASTYQEELDEQENTQMNNYDSLNVRASQDTQNQYLIDSQDRENNNAQHSHKNYQNDISRNSHITDHSYIDTSNNNNNTSGLSAAPHSKQHRQQYISRPIQSHSHNASNVRGSGSSVLVSQSGLMNTSGNLVSTSHLNPFKTGHLNISNNILNQQNSVNYDNYNSNPIVERQLLGHLIDNPNRKNIKQQGSDNKAQFNSTQRSKMTTELSPYGQDSSNRKHFNTISPEQASSQRGLYQLSERQSSQRQLSSQDQQLSTDFQQEKQSLNNTTGNISNTNNNNNNNRHSSAKSIPRQQYQHRQQQYSQQQQLSSQQLLHNASNSPFKFQETFTNRQDIACEYSDSERNQRSQNTNHLSPSPPIRNSQQSMEGEFSPLDIPEENKKVFQNDTLFMKKSFQHSFSRPVTNRSDYL